MKNTHNQSETSQAMEVEANLSDIVAKINQSVKDIVNSAHKIKIARERPKVGNNEVYVNRAANETSRIACELRKMASQFIV